MAIKKKKKSKANVIHTCSVRKWSSILVKFICKYIYSLCIRIYIWEWSLERFFMPSEEVKFYMKQVIQNMRILHAWPRFMSFGHVVILLSKKKKRSLVSCKFFVFRASNIFVKRTRMNSMHNHILGLSHMELYWRAFDAWKCFVKWSKVIVNCFVWKFLAFGIK